MNIPTVSIKIQKNTHSLSLIIMTVYFLIFFITIVGSNIVQAAPKNLENQLYIKLNDEIRKNKDQKIDLLYTLLVAEIAASRDLKNIACENYFKVALLSKDPKIAEEATLTAINFEAPKEAILNALLWAKIDPDNLQAQLITMTLLLSQSTEQALPYLIRATEINPKEIDQHLLEIQSRLSEESAHNLQAGIEQIANNNPNDPYLQFTAAQSAAIQGNFEKAKMAVTAALKLKPDLTRAIELNAQVIRNEHNNDAPALEYLKVQIDTFPENGELRVFYANALLDINERQAAKNILLPIKENSAVRDQSLLLLGEIYLKEQDWKNTSNYLEKALSFPRTRDTAEYLLGEMAEQQQQFDQAISWFSEIEQGPLHIAARLRAVTLLKQAKQYDDAIYLLHNSSPNTMEEQKYLLLTEMDLLNADKEYEDALQIANDILPQLPEDLDVLFMRAVTATKLKKWDMAEGDFKKILLKSPNDPNVLNGLGYTLSFDMARLPEALNYSTQALKVAPNNPDYMDSVGWIYFKMGDQQQALQYLKNANEISQDNTIAAHLGEVLWANNQKKEALAVWKKALKQDGDNEELLETLKRLKVDLAGN